MGEFMTLTTLKNGLRIAFEQQDTARSAAIHIYVACGNRNETADNMGVSHFIEHMVFKGTTTRSAEEIASVTDMLGGNINAFTAKENTCFFARALCEHVPTMFEILCDMVCNPLFDKKDMDTERGVILEEIGMYEDSAEDLCADLLNEVVWQDNPLSFNILGTRETVSNLAAEDLRAQMEKYYVPERIVISLCGKFDENAVLEIINKYFLDKKNTGNPVEYNQDVFFEGIRLKNKESEQTQIAYAFKGVPLNDKQRYAIAIFSVIAGGGASSRLNRRIREELGLVYSVYAYHCAYMGGGMFGVSAGLAAQNQKKFLEESLNVLHNLTESISEQELFRTKEQFKASTVMGMESVSGISSTMGRQLLLQGDYIDMDEVINEIDSIKLEDIKNAANLLIDPKNIALCVVGDPKEEDFYRNILQQYC